MTTQPHADTRFFGEAISVVYDTPPLLSKTPPCPDGFHWRGRDYRVAELLSEWSDFSRRGRMSRNMRPENAQVAVRRGSWGVGRFYFRVRVDGGAVYDLYFDRAPRSADDRSGGWTLFRELIDDDNATAA